MGPDHIAYLVAEDRGEAVHDADTGPERADSLSARFRDVACNQGDKVAARCGDRELSYDALDRLSSQLANRLRRMGVSGGALVGLHVGRNLDILVSILGIIKAGGAYLPMDPVYPADRLAFMADDANVGIIVTRGALAGNLVDTGAVLVDIGDCGGESASSPLAETGGGDLAYVIYTSGSTGKPKGVAVSHANILRLFDSTQHWFGFGSDDVWTLFHSYSFDFSVWEIWGALLYGGCVVVVPVEVGRSTEAFRSLVLAEGVTVLNQTPSAFRRFIQADRAAAPADYALRHVIFGGEALEFQSLRPWFARYGDRSPRLINMYGITETTVHVTYRPVTVDDLDAGRGSIIGEPIPDLTLHILDESMRPVPTGVSGEIYVGGAGVASGYLNRPELTAHRFLVDPFSSDRKARLYRTGDLALRNREGEIEYLGRADHQVKIRGFRIELGEIEAQITRDEAVRNAAVIARPDRSGEPQIVAYLVTDQTAGEGLAARLPARLRAVLPDYMLPAHFVLIDDLPLTENGKLDRARLPEPGQARASAAYVAPKGERQELIARIWSDVLGAEQIGAHDDFFELGGHSLLIIDVLQRLRAHGLHVSAGDMFLTPTIAAIADLAEQHGSTGTIALSNIPPHCDAIRPDMLDLVTLNEDEIALIERTVPGGAANIQDIYPLTPLQEGIFYHHRVSASGDPYLVTTLMAARSHEQAMRYAAAVQAVVDRHDILRSAFLAEGLRHPMQIVCREARVPVEEMQFDPAEGDVAGQLLDRFDMCHHRLAVDRAPAIRLYIAQDPANGRWLILRSHHHLIEDHTTDELMSGEIAALMADEGADFPEPLPFRAFVARTADRAKDPQSREWFGELLGDVDEPTAAFGLTETAQDEPIKDARLRLDDALSERLRIIARKQGVGVASLFHLAWGLVVGQSCGRGDVVFGTVLFGRMQAGDHADRILGPMINTLPLRLRFAGRSVAEALTDTHELLAGLLRHEHASLAMAQACSRLAPGVPLFNALINFRHVQIRGGRESTRVHAMGPAIEAMGLELLSFTERTNYALELSVDDLGDGFMVEAQSRHPVDPAMLCDAVAAALEDIAAKVESEPDARTEDVRILSAAAERRLLHDFNDTVTEFGTPQRLHAAFEAQAARTPAAVALEFEGREMSYGELDRRANALARALREAGVGRDALVGVCAERSFEMVVALYAALKAGGAYVPLDPSLPAARLADMLADAAPRVVLCQPHLRDRIAGFEGMIVSLDLTAEADIANGAPLLDEGEPGDLAYVIFTSGSTGRPKAAMNEHRGIVNRLNWMQAEYGLTADDRVLQKTPFSFDVSVWEFFWPLMVGARVVIARPDGHRDSGYLAELIRSRAITTLHFVPSMLRVFLEEPAAADCPSIRRVICSGEALTHDLQTAFFDRFAAADLHNLYGPTEAGVDVTHWTCRRDGQGTVVPIGRPVANTRIHILDDRLRPVLQGAPGHVFIGGVQVGRGYLGQGELTAERFVADPFSGDPAARIYRTGDVGRYLPDGTIEYLGRSDFQVKIRGQRIELGEIEARLEEIDGISQGVVVARDDPVQGAQLVAYYVVSDQPIDPAHLSAELGRSLPSYMVPAIIVELAEMPLTSSGKIDRKAFPEPGPAERQRSATPPRDDVERAMAAIWQDMLGVSEIGIDEDFFALGGHSLLALQMLVRLERQMGLRIPIRTVVEGRTIRHISDGREITAGTDLPEGLIRLHGSASQRPLFCIPGAGGVALQFENLARKLEGDRAVYAFELHEMDTGPARWPTMQDYTQAVARAMRDVQPDGPYSLIGFSSGGNLAVEVAAFLESQGQKVDTLWVVDSYAPGTIYLTSQLARWKGHFDEILGLPLHEIPGHLRFRARRMFGRLPKRRRGETELEFKLRLAEERAEKAQKNYAASSVRTAIHWTRASGTMAENFWATFVDPTETGGWIDLCSEVKVYRFECGHHAMLKEPQLGRLADHISESLRAGGAPALECDGSHHMAVCRKPSAVEPCA